MRHLLRMVGKTTQSALHLFAGKAEHLHLARAVRAVSPKMLPRWRNLGTAITPYHYMKPILIPVRNHKR